ncbi:hypothetical protein [Burkholderia stagnalis]|uniref:hypothetical protein n=1 Tax=Burkholderia stagnalis TaxID=1503054 RepID=UPI0012D9CFD1|nr:hypothetical protein [Burkholderia stagnalis]
MMFSMHQYARTARAILAASEGLLDTLSCRPVILASPISPSDRHHHDRTQRGPSVRIRFPARKDVAGDTPVRFDSAVILVDFLMFGGLVAIRVRHAFD